MTSVEHPGFHVLAVVDTKLLKTLLKGGCSHIPHCLHKNSLEGRMPLRSAYNFLDERTQLSTAYNSLDERTQLITAYNSLDERTQLIFHIACKLSINRWADIIKQTASIAELPSL